MSATEELRRMLDERGIAWRSISNAGATEYTHEGIVYRAYEVYGKIQVSIITLITPEQAIATIVGPQITGETSDGYHTFNELYHHRATLFSVVVHDHRDIAWKSRKHHDGTMYDGMFIVGIETPQGQATYHYIDPYWDAFDCDELERAPEWDGHTPAEAIERIGGLARPGATGAGTCSMELLPDEPTTSIQPMRCTACGHKTYAQLANYCPNCGAEVVV